MLSYSLSVPKPPFYTLLFKFLGLRLCTPLFFFSVSAGSLSISAIRWLKNESGRREKKRSPRPPLCYCSHQHLPSGASTPWQWCLPVAAIDYNVYVFPPLLKSGPLYLLPNSRTMQVALPPRLSSPLFGRACVPLHPRPASSSKASSPCSPAWGAAASLLLLQCILLVISIFQ